MSLDRHRARRIQYDQQDQQPVPTCTHRPGLPVWIAPDERDACDRCLTSAEHDLIELYDRQAERVGIAPDAWPYGPNIRIGDRGLLLDWAQRLQVTAARPPHRCLSWVRTGRCSTSCRWEPPAWPRWADHVTAWKRGKDRLLVSQPHHLSNADVDELGDLEILGRQHGDLGVRISRDPWYAPTHVLIELWSRPDHADEQRSAA